MLTVLQHIDAVLQQMRRTVNAVSGQLMAMATAVECITLSLKLQHTLRRWSVYLPFKECGDVDFKWWVGYLSGVHKNLNSLQTDSNGSSDFYYPDAPFSLDFSEFLERTGVTAADDSATDENTDNQEQTANLPLFQPRYAESELNTDVSEYVSRIDEQMDYIRSLSDDDEQDWRDNIDRRAIAVLRMQYTDYLRFILTNRNQQTPHEYEKTIVPKVKSYLNTIVNETSMAYCLDMALSTLIDNLRQMDELLNNNITEQQHLRLSLRLFYRYCPDVKESAERDAHRWVNEWPLRKRQERAHEKLERLKTNVRRLYGEFLIEDFIDLDHPSPLTDPEFGRFLFVNRSLLSIDDVRQIFIGCFRIQQVNNIIDPRAEEQDIAATRLSQERRQLYERLKALVLQANWQKITADDVLNCFAELLLPQPGVEATEEKTKISESFWQLLTHRRGCDSSFRSLKLTWLNLIGYFISRGVLTGGSKNLCVKFFPNSSHEGNRNDLDYNHILKGADHRAPNDFQDLRPVLDKILGLEEKKKEGAKKGGKKPSLDSNGHLTRVK